eukprot:RCo012494
MLGRIRALDVYPKTLDEFKEKTVTGATISVLSVVSILVLIVSEIQYYRVIDRIDDLYVDTLPEDKLQININITFPQIACEVLHLDTMDGFGEAQVNVEQDIHKVPLDHDGDPLPLEKKDAAVAVVQVDPKYCGPCYGAEERPEQCCNTCGEVKEAYRKKGWAINLSGGGIEQCAKEVAERESHLFSDHGCVIYGFLKVNKVQGNFHFAPGKSFQMGGSHVHDFLPAELEHYNTSHIIHRLGFGADYPGIINPLDNRQHILPKTHTGLFQYFIKVVPTIYENLGGQKLRTNQYSVTEHFKPKPVPSTEPSQPGGTLPGVFFIYDFSPIMVHIREAQRHRSALHFLTNLCSIVGGVFTVAGIVDRLLYHSLRNLRKRMEGGKGS